MRPSATHGLPNQAQNKSAAAPLPGLDILLVTILGFRCASPQALYFHPLRGLTRFSLEVDRSYQHEL